ncbi:MAG: hypothetical protein ACP5J1_04710 [Fervidicoccaceae archaeon]
MEGLSSAPRLFEELMKSWEYTLTGEETNEGSNEHERSPGWRILRVMCVYRRIAWLRTHFLAKIL